jgi:hypothetical protein
MSYLVQWLQALATPVIALLAAVIGFGQWRTNRTKLALDLFEKRFAVFMDVRRIASEAVQQGKLTDWGLPHEVLARGRFLFGSEVQKALDDLGEMTARFNAGDASAAVQIDEQFRRMIPMFEQYLRMQEKVPSRLC